LAIGTARTGESTVNLMSTHTHTQQNTPTEDCKYVKREESHTNATRH